MEKEREEVEKPLPMERLRKVVHYVIDHHYCPDIEGKDSSPYVNYERNTETDGIY